MPRLRSGDAPALDRGPCPARRARSAAAEPRCAAEQAARSPREPSSSPSPRGRIGATALAVLAEVQLAAGWRAGRRFPRPALALFELKGNLAGGRMRAKRHELAI